MVLDLRQRLAVELAVREDAAVGGDHGQSRGGGGSPLVHGRVERADDIVSTFSAGMRKRLGIARILLQEASVVLLDEPYGQLDPPGFRFVDGLFKTLRERGVTVLLSTHQLERGANLCDRGLVLKDGRAIWSGPAGELPGHSGLQLPPEDAA